KRFASGAPVGDLLVTTAPCEDTVIHFALPFKTEGVSIHDDWNTLGMRGTGSHTVELKDVFVPEASVSLTRARGQWHPAWSVTMTVAPPIYMAPYLGIAERAAELAREDALRRKSEWTTWQALGELENVLTTAQMAHREMVELANEYDFKPEVERASRMLVRKTIASNALLETVTKAVESIGGKSLFRRNTIERLLRDIQGARFHPLPEKQQLAFTGRVELGLSPVV
ncbi:MAG TPA: acyl-CoA dehydrogenase family protein, partial [Polyangiales bacterium]|nr:acyl-CoA dehydrogenase family protein [Polyangiales bacterium]